MITHATELETSLTQAFKDHAKTAGLGINQDVVARIIRTALDAYLDRLYGEEGA